MMILAAPNDGSFLLSLGSRYRLLRPQSGRNDEGKRGAADCDHSAVAMTRVKEGRLIATTQWSQWGV
jgi:hypothetical protein